MKKITVFFFFLICFCLVQTKAEDRKQGFAIVIDPISHQKAQKELEAYIHALEEKQNLKVYTLIDHYGVPDSIRTTLMNLYNKKEGSIIGAVFIGDIPIPMIRDAQYLTSAFKMDQKRPWQESSVPSDRFYDDFGLKFKFLKKDSLAPFYYYSLSAEGNQKLNPSIFSGRIRPTDSGNTSKYQKLRAYLQKVVEDKLNPEKINSVFVYTGSGSLTESKVAHICEMNTMREHFPSLQSQPNAFRYMDYSDDANIKEKFMNEVMKPDLSIAFMHHHGDFDTQYLSSYPKPNTIKETKDYLLHLYRSRLARAQHYGYNVDSIRQSFVTKDGIPASWLSELTDCKIKEKDSIENTAINLILKDFSTYHYKPNCRIAVLDACYNGSFHRDDCIANEYIFQNGKTICCLGGSVNVLQDKWTDRYFGLLNEGVMIGYINQYNPDLEMHIIGDPTFVFRTSSTDNNLNNLFAQKRKKHWKKQLSKSINPDVQSMAIRQLSDAGYMTSEELFSLLKSSPSNSVRLEAFMALLKGNNETRVKALKIAANDNYELLQRFAVNNIIKSGDERLLPIYARILCDNNASARVHFNAIQGAQFFSKEKLLAAVDKELSLIRPYLVNPDEFSQEVYNIVASYSGRWEDDILKFCDGTMSKKRALLQASFMKIYLPPYLLEKLSNHASTLKDYELLCPLLNALGWHRIAYNSDIIKNMTLKLSNDPSLPYKVRQEALKTYKRINNK